MNTKPKLFRDQYLECAELGLNKEKGEFLSFKEHPELIPFLPSKKMIKDIKSGKWAGIQTIKCGKFGGICSGSNKDCRKLRKIVEK